MVCRQQLTLKVSAFCFNLISRPRPNLILVHYISVLKVGSKIVFRKCLKIFNILKSLALETASFPSFKWNSLEGEHKRGPQTDLKSGHAESYF